MHIVKMSKGHGVTRRHIAFISLSPSKPPFHFSFHSSVVEGKTSKALRFNSLFVLHHVLVQAGDGRMWVS